MDDKEHIFNHAIISLKQNLTMDEINLQESGGHDKIFSFLEVMLKREELAIAVLNDLINDVDLAQVTLEDNGNKHLPKSPEISTDNLKQKYCRVIALGYLQLVKEAIKSRPGYKPMIISE